MDVPYMWLDYVTDSLYGAIVWITPLFGINIMSC